MAITRPSHEVMPAKVRVKLMPFERKIRVERPSNIAEHMSCMQVEAAHSLIILLMEAGLRTILRANGVSKMAKSVSDIRAGGDG
jgi:hypothetical protein